MTANLVLTTRSVTAVGPRSCNPTFNRTASVRFVHHSRSAPDIPAGGFKPRGPLDDPTRVPSTRPAGEFTKKVQVERILETLEPIAVPKSDVEQYATPAGVAAEVGYLALARHDLVGRRVLDAGTGNGILAIAASLLGASSVVGVDLDPDAVDVARRNGRKVGADVTWRVMDVRALREPFDTILMTPPFGSQRKHADLPFLERGLELGRVLYTFHNAKSERFIARRIESRGGRITDRIEYSFPIPRTFRFHRKNVARIPVVLFRVEAAK